MTNGSTSLCKKAEADDKVPVMVLVRAKKEINPVQVPHSEDRARRQESSEKKVTN